MEWLLLDPVGGKHRGVISPLIASDHNHLPQTKGWFDWKTYVISHSRMQVYKLQRKDMPEILGVIALEYRDGVFVDSVETAPHSRYMPPGQKVYVNLADIMLSFAAVWGTINYNDNFVGLIPKTNLQSYYIRKFGARPVGRIYALDPVVIAQMVGLYYI